ncbi:MAG: adenylate/guanylate cyclase domain-containing protein [Saprospiraceae bacterium]|nr:adenylate/guanylate cyclase domain-containing protein [Saprospiraceae bacterium]
MAPKARKLAAIVFADIAGYTALMQTDEERALSWLNHFSTTVRSQAKAHNGEVAQFYGDGCLLLFDSVQDAVVACENMQRSFVDPTVNVPVRIGVHNGEVVYRDDNVFSDSVNIASRIESMGIPGSILISKTAQSQIRNKPRFALVSLGHFDFKNVEEPIEVFALANQGLEVPVREQLQGKFKEASLESSSVTRKWLAIPVVLLAGLLVWLFAFRDQEPETGTATSVRSLAIFPFANQTQNPDLEYLADGVAEHLISAVADQTDLEVLSRYSTFAVRDSMHNLPFIRKRLNVDALLVGNVDSSNGGLAFRTELISPGTQERIWGTTVTGTTDDLKQVEAGIVDGLLSALKIKPPLTSDADRYATQPDAYRHYMQGRYLSFGHTREEIDLSVEHFHKAIEIDGNFAPAYAALANQKFAQARFSNTTRQELIREAKLAIRNALTLDPDLPEAHLAEANIRFYCDFDWDAAAQSYRKALDADPDNVQINTDYAFFLCAMGDYKEALPLAQKAVQEDPVSIGSMHIIAWTNLYLDPHESVQQFDDIIQLHPRWIWGYMKKGMALLLVGDCDAAMQMFEEVEQRKGAWGGELIECYLSVLYRKCGHSDLAETKLQFVEEHVARHGVSDPLDLAILYGGNGDIDKMITFARQCIDQKSVNAALMQLPRNLDFFVGDPLEDPRYVSLLKEMGFPNT